MLNNTSPLSLLLTKAEASLPDPTPAQREILVKLKGVQTRIEEGRLRVAVLGQFKRGKSTLLNALLGIPLLPTGITPVTAIPTFILAANSPSIRVEFDDAKEPFRSQDESDFPNILARYVSEGENPDNRAKVCRVEIAVTSASLMRSAPLGGASLLSSKSTVGRPFAYVAFFWTFSSTSRGGNSSNSVRLSQFRPTRPFPFSLSAISQLGLCSQSTFPSFRNESLPYHFARR